MQDGDAVVIFNFRSDRVIEISKAFEYEDFTAFDRKRFPKARLAPLLLCAAIDVIVIHALPATRCCSCIAASLEPSGVPPSAAPVNGP